jgi:hypothetical protein
LAPHAAEESVSTAITMRALREDEIHPCFLKDGARFTLGISPAPYNLC